MKSDLPTKMGVIAFIFVLLSIIIFGALSIVSNNGCSKVSATAKQVVVRERIEESERVDIWRTSIYRLDSVTYDTIPKKTSWDTAHELPR